MARLSLSTIALMHATLVARPFHHPGWVYEEKGLADRDDTLPPEEARRWAVYVAALNAPREIVTITVRTRSGCVRRWRVPGDLPVDDVYFAIICPGCQS